MVTTVKSREPYPPGPSLFGMSAVCHAINAHKALTLPLILLLLYVHGNWTQPAIFYCLIHGLYGQIWLLKHMTFRDRNFDMPCTPGMFVQCFIMVGLYWVGSFMIARYRKSEEMLPTWELALVLVLYIGGMFLHYVSDCQKYAILTTRGRGLITTGLFSLVRNPNYLGEMLIYTSFVVLCRSYAALAITLFFFSAVFIPNMLKKDESLSKYGKEWEEYKKRTWLVFPFVY